MRVRLRLTDPGQKPRLCVVVVMVGPCWSFSCGLGGGSRSVRRWEVGVVTHPSPPCCLVLKTEVKELVVEREGRRMASALLRYRLHFQGDCTAKVAVLARY